MISTAMRWTRIGFAALPALRLIFLFGSVDVACGMEAYASTRIAYDIQEIELRQDDDSGRLFVLIDGRTAFVYQYSPNHDLPHYWPLNSPSGKNLLIQQTEPYPHHRSFWFADTVRLEGYREVSTYNALYSGQVIGRNAWGPPFRDHVRHFEFSRLETRAGRAVIHSRSIWEMDGDLPVLDEERRVLVFALGGGEYLLDVTFTLEASYGDVEFVSDAVHYAWPYLRMHPVFSGENGGTLITDGGAAGQEATDMKAARWIDYSNTVQGETEGVAVFQWPDGEDHRWLTREYGCFGPRRPDDRSGEPFVLAEGDSISQRVGILVHRGDVESGKVAERYRDYVAGKWRE
jgi:hypothetical protein